MYIAECSYRAGDVGLIFLPDGSGHPCDLSVDFRPLAYYPAEPDIGQGPDFDAAIVTIQIRDPEDGNKPQAWHKLDGADFEAAKRFLDRHHSTPMWAQAEIETAEAFGAAADFRCAA